MNTNIIINTKLYKGQANPLEVKWEMEYTYESTGPGDYDDEKGERREFCRLIAVHIVLADKQSVDVTEHYRFHRGLYKRVKDDLMKDAEDKSIKELTESAETENLLAQINSTYQLEGGTLNV